MVSKRCSSFKFTLADAKLFVVPRPAIIEEFGLRLLLEAEGVGVEFTREKYESGDWAEAVETAWKRGAAKKKARQEAGEETSRQRKAEGREMAKSLMEWVAEWQRV